MIDLTIGKKEKIILTILTYFPEVGRTHLYQMLFKAKEALLDIPFVFKREGGTLYSHDLQSTLERLKTLKMIREVRRETGFFHSRTEYTLTPKGKAYILTHPLPSARILHEFLSHLQQDVEEITVEKPYAPELPSS